MNSNIFFSITHEGLIDLLRDLKILLVKVSLMTTTSLLFPLIPCAYGQEEKQLQNSNEDIPIIIESDIQSNDSVSGVFTAVGNVKVTQPSNGLLATSRQAQYFRKEGIVVLSGDVELVREDGISMRGERLVYKLDEDQLMAESNSDSQVHTRFLLDSLNGDERQETP